MSWEVTPATVPRGGDMTLTLAVRNAANPQELARPDLSQINAFTQRFQILPAPPPAAVPSTAREVKFVYHVRPVSVDVKDVPALKYVYYQPASREGKRFPTTYAREVPITVTVPPPPPAAVVTAPPVPVEAPEEFFVWKDFSTTWTLRPARFSWLAPVAVVPFVVGLWVAGWRWLFPDAARLAKLRRHRAVRAALGALKKARSAADPAGAAGAALRTYLATRYGMFPGAQTPAEVRAALDEVAFPAERAADAESFLRACDATRFAQEIGPSVALTIEAEKLIVTWEGVRE
ncbi:hypothetical protein FRUB_01986 [Fimbriiglobus ruber]|uniref:BatD n=1 Tax=Fimbriiglobus ruber TaxID=1908690 RepID=A0A225EAS4_9BACT|nr:hypothetical protein FRUB_01986 [Fimbriiglobus ruber]